MCVCVMCVRVCTCVCDCDCVCVCDYLGQFFDCHAFDNVAHCIALLTTVGVRALHHLILYAYAQHTHTHTHTHTQERFGRGGGERNEREKVCVRVCVRMVAVFLSYLYILRKRLLQRVVVTHVNSEGSERVVAGYAETQLYE